MQPMFKMERPVKYLFSFLILFASGHLFALETLDEAGNPYQGWIVKVSEDKEAQAFLDEQNIKYEELNLEFGSYLLIEKEEDFKRVKSFKFVESSSPNYLIHEYGSNVDVYDPHWRSQWGFENTGTNNWVKGPKGEDIHALEAWKIEKGDPYLMVAVIDSGIDLSHPDLKQNIFINDAELNGQSGIDDDGNGLIDDVSGWDFARDDNNPDDELGHGTHVSGIIGATHNDIGVRGIMDKVKILPIKFLIPGGGSTAKALVGINYAIKMGAKIINNSWGGGGYSQAFYDAIKYANDQRVIFVMAAGNSNSDNDASPRYPADYDLPNVLTIGATNAHGKKASFSNFGKKSVDLFAPGIQIVSTERAGTYTWKTGTSMAAPMVSGALGLALSKNPKMEMNQLISKIMSTTDNKDVLQEFGRAGRLNLATLLKDL